MPGLGSRWQTLDHFLLAMHASARTNHSFEHHRRSKLTSYLDSRPGLPFALVWPSRRSSVLPRRVQVQRVQVPRVLVHDDGSRPLGSGTVRGRARLSSAHVRRAFEGPGPPRLGNVQKVVLVVNFSDTTAASTRFPVACRRRSGRRPLEARSEGVGPAPASLHQRKRASEDSDSNDGQRCNYLPRTG